MGLEERRDAADAGADEDAESRAVDLAGVERGVLDGQDCGRHRELQIGVESPRFLLVDEVQRIEVLHLTGDTGRIAGGVEVRDHPYARPPLDERGPELGRRITDRREGPETGDD